MTTLHVLMGMPGSGKTRWVTANLRNRTLCSTEKLRTQHGNLGGPAVAAFLNSLRRRAAQALHTGHDTVVDACNTRAQERAIWLNLARRHHATTELVVVEATLAQALDAQQLRDNPVPEPRMAAYYRDYQHALRVIGSEGWDTITRISRDGTTTHHLTDPAPFASQWWKAP